MLDSIAASRAETLADPPCGLVPSVLCTALIAAFALLCSAGWVSVAGVLLALDVVSESSAAGYADGIIGSLSEARP